VLALSALPRTLCTLITPPTARQTASRLTASAKWLHEPITCCVLAAGGAGDGAADVTAGGTSWSCLNRTDLQRGRRSLSVSRVPVLLLERLTDLSLFKLLATVAAPAAHESPAPPPLEMQRRIFRAQLAKARASEVLRPYEDALPFLSGLLLGVSRGLAAMHRARVVHRDLTEPGKNVLLKRDSLGLTAALIDLSQAERCPSGRGAAARALDMYGFGNLLYFACYGRVAHSLPWTGYSCTGQLRGLEGLLAMHHRLHPAGKPAPAHLLNRCHEHAVATMDGLMNYCWAPALAAATAAVGGGVSQAGSSAPSRGVGEAAARVNHTWDEVIRQLEALREQRRPLFNGVR